MLATSLQGRHSVMPELYITFTGLDYRVVVHRAQLCLPSLEPRSIPME